MVQNVLQLVATFESSLVISREARAAQASLLGHFRQVVREQKLSVDDIRVQWGVSSEFAELIVEGEGAVERVASPSESLLLFLHQEEDLLLARCWCTSIDGPNRIRVSGDFSRERIDRWQELAASFDVEIVWHDVAISRLELAYYLQRMSDGIGAPKVSVASVQYCMDGAEVHGDAEHEECEAWRKILPPWIVLTRVQSIN